MQRAQMNLSVPKFKSTSFRHKHIGGYAKLNYKVDNQVVQRCPVMKVLDVTKKSAFICILNKPYQRFIAYLVLSSFTAENLMILTWQRAWSTAALLQWYPILYDLICTKAASVVWSILVWSFLFSLIRSKTEVYRNELPHSQSETKISCQTFLIQTFTWCYWFTRIIGFGIFDSKLLNETQNRPTIIVSQHTTSY